MMALPVNHSFSNAIHVNEHDLADFTSGQELYSPNPQTQSASALEATFQGVTQQGQWGF